MEILFMTGNSLTGYLILILNGGIKPLAQMGFMPEALSAKPQPYRHYWKPGDPYDEFIGMALSAC